MMCFALTEGMKRIFTDPLDESDAIPGYYIATGVSGHGFGIGPGAGKATAGMLTNTDTGIDLSEFRLGRFFDGSKLRLNVQV